MNIFRKIRNYFCYCGIEKEEYNTVRKDAYISNFEVWRILHILMFSTYAILFVNSLASDILKQNMIFYLVGLIYSALATLLFLFVFKKDSLIAQLFIYLSISLLFLFAGLISQKSPNLPATTFVVLLLITPMFMIDKPYFMTIELIVASIIFLVWMHSVKDYDIWVKDFVNIVTFTLIGIFLHVVANSIRIKEFILTHKINVQKDLDDITGLKNKGALTREINAYLADSSKTKGLMFLLDIDHFKAINDTYGHDVGDSVIAQLGTFLGNKFTNNEIVGRFGGDEFIIFIKDNDNLAYASTLARDIISGVERFIKVPDESKIIQVSVGIAIYQGIEKNYSEIFKKADIALYQTKDDRANKFRIF